MCICEYNWWTCYGQYVTHLRTASRERSVPKMKSVTGQTIPIWNRFAGSTAPTQELLWIYYKTITKTSKQFKKEKDCQSVLDFFIGKRFIMLMKEKNSWYYETRNWQRAMEKIFEIGVPLPQLDGTEQYYLQGKTGPSINNRPKSRDNLRTIKIKKTWWTNPSRITKVPKGIFSWGVDGNSVLLMISINLILFDAKAENITFWQRVSESMTEESLLSFVNWCYISSKDKEN